MTTPTRSDAWLPRPSLLALCCLAALVPAIGQAQSQAAAGSTALPDITVKAKASTETATSPVPGYTVRRSGTATKTDTPLNEVPQSISVITADQIRDQNSQTMQDVLRYTAGVRSELYGLDNRGDWFALRGGSEGSTLLDGLRLPLTGYYGVVRNEPFAFERIEVLRGPASVIAGQNGPGGVVNLVSKRPQADAVREIQVQLGNDDHKQVSLDVGGVLTDDGSLLYRFVGLTKDSGTQIQHADERRLYLAPSLTWNGRGTTFTAYAEYQNDRSNATNAFLPVEGTLKPAPNGRIPTDLFIGEPDWDRYGGQRRRIGYELEQTLNDQWTLRHHLRHDELSGGLRSLYAAWWLGFADATGTADPTGQYLNRVFFANNERGRITNSDVLLEGKLDLGHTRHTLLMGVDFMNNVSQQLNWDEVDGTPLNVYNPVYGSYADPLQTGGVASTYTETRARNVGLLVQDQIKFGEHWVLVAGLRHDKARIQTDTADAKGTPQKDSATSKNLGLVYKAGDWSPYISYSESFEPVVGKTYDGSPFKPKRGKQVEAGVKWAPVNQRIGASASVYKLKETNRLTTDPDPTHPDSSIQLGEVTVKGIELELNAHLPAWDLLASYTYTDAQETSVGSSDPATLGQQLTSIPQNSASVWALHKFGAYGLPGLRAGAGVRYIGETTDGTGENGVPSVALLDLMVSYDTGPWRLALNIANATDKTYIATCLSRGDCWFGTRRKAVASLAYHW